LLARFAWPASALLTNGPELKVMTTTKLKRD
jgi:hypothetical protein